MPAQSILAAPVLQEMFKSCAVPILSLPGGFVIL